MAEMQDLRSMQELERNIPDNQTGWEISRRAGAQAMVGFELYLNKGREGTRRKVRVERLNPDGQTYRVMDLVTKKEMPKDILP
jgi:hypothetical protein